MQRGSASHRARSPFLTLATAGPGHALFYRAPLLESRGFPGAQPSRACRSEWDAH